MKKTTISIITLFFIFNLNAQEISSRLLDSITKEPVPFATIIFKKRGTVSNEEGRFSFIYGKNATPNDTLKISCIGFKTIAEPLTYFKDSIIYMAPQTNELKEVILTNKNYTPEEIIKKVKENITKNYNTDLTTKRLFFRSSNHQNLSRLNYKLRKSTIKEFNEQFIDSVIQSLPKNNSYYSDVLCDLYGDLTVAKQKIALIKAAELYDKNNEISFEGMEKKLNAIIEKNVKKDSYFKFKSGIFGQKVTMEELAGKEVDTSSAEKLKKMMEEKKKMEANRKKHFANYKKRDVANLMKNLFFQEDTNLNFLKKSNRYKFELRELTYLGENAVYVLDFKPKRSEDYKGTLYVDISDFAVVRADYENVKPLKSFSLLGVSYKENLAKGKVIFSRGDHNKYNLKYLEYETGTRVGVKRPFKIIEKNKHVKGRRKQNELSMKIDLVMTSKDKREVVVFDTNTLTTSEYETYKENNTVLPVYQKAYDPEFWKGYNIIEPNKAIREYTVVEE